MDIVSAFYSIIREYHVPCASSDDAIAHLFATLGLDIQAVHQLAELLAAPNALASAGVPDLLQYAISHHLEGTFFDMAGTEAFGSARVGARPGHPFADLIFNFALGLIMQKIGAALQAEYLVPSYAASDRLSLVDTHFTSMVQGATIGFVDDLFFDIEVDNAMVIAEGRMCLIRRIARALQIIASIFGDHGLRLNDKRGKTMVTLQYTVQAKAAKQFIRDLDHIIVDMDPRKDLHVHVTHIYKHLGGQVCSNSDMREELAFRAGTSHSVERSSRNKCLLTLGSL